MTAPHNGRTPSVGRAVVAIVILLGIAVPVFLALAFDDRLTELDRAGTTASQGELDQVETELTRLVDAGRRYVDGLEVRLEDLEGRIARLEGELDRIEGRIAEAEDEAAAVTIPPTTTTTAPPPQRLTSSTGAPWPALAACESTGDHDGVEPHRIDPAAVSPTGKYRGAFQFDLPTWQSVGGTGDPAAHTYAEQLDRARALQARRGWAPWPRCSELLGLA